VPEASRYHHISSAVVMVVPSRVAEIVQAITRLEDTEICAQENGRIVVVMEAASVGELGGRLTAIGNLEGVIAANMVFEHVEELREAEP
jgi:periplasmic nitrate reductase NapD